MFYLSKDKELTVEILKSMIESFQINVAPRLQKYRNYYEGEQNILKKAYSDPTKPCNKTVINYCKNIVDSYCGYLATPGFISYQSEEDITEIMNTLRYNDYQSEDSDLLKDALIYGVASELMYVDNESRTRFKMINPTTCFGVYDNSLTSDLLYFIRFYKIDEWDKFSDNYYVDVYGDKTIRRYKMNGMISMPEFIEEMPHFFGQCPANILVMPDEKNIFDCILSEQDSVNELLSSEIDDYAAFCDAYLVLENAEVDSETIQTMRTNRVLLLPENAKAYWLTKSANDVQVENILKRLHDSIYRIAQCPDFSSETFVGGVSSGIAIQYRLTGMETRAGKIEAELKKALQRRVEVISGMAALKLGESTFRDIEITFKRNIPVDESASISMITSLKGMVSDSTLLAQLPFIPDVNKELEKLQAQKEAEMEIYGGDLFSMESEVEKE